MFHTYSEIIGSVHKTTSILSNHPAKSVWYHWGYDRLNKATAFSFVIIVCTGVTIMSSWAKLRFPKVLRTSRELRKFKVITVTAYICCWPSTVLFLLVWLNGTVQLCLYIFSYSAYEMKLLIKRLQLTIYWHSCLDNLRKPTALPVWMLSSAGGTHSQSIESCGFAWNCAATRVWPREAAPCACILVQGWVLGSK